MTRINVLLVEDHETVRHGLKLVIDGQPDMAVIGEAGDGRGAVTRAQDLHPTVAVVDISMPDMNGLETTRLMRRLVPETAVVALTRYDDEAYVQALMAAGAQGYVLKQSAPSELLKAIRTVAGGKEYLDSTLGARFPLRKSRTTTTTTTTTTPRETEVLRLVALGHSNKEIAASLKISVKTVEIHKTNALRKLGLKGRIDIVRFAMLQGWLKQA